MNGKRTGAVMLAALLLAGWAGRPIGAPRPADRSIDSAVIGYLTGGPRPTRDGAA